MTSAFDALDALVSGAAVASSGYGQARPGKASIKA